MPAAPPFLCENGAALLLTRVGDSIGSISNPNLVVLSPASSSSSDENSGQESIVSGSHFSALATAAAAKMFLRGTIPLPFFAAARAVRRGDRFRLAIDMGDGSFIWMSDGDAAPTHIVRARLKGVRVLRLAAAGGGGFMLLMCSMVVLVGWEILLLWVAGSSATGESRDKELRSVPLGKSDAESQVLVETVVNAS